MSTEVGQQEFTQQLKMLNREIDRIRQAHLRQIEMLANEKDRQISQMRNEMQLALQEEKAILQPVATQQASTMTDQIQTEIVIPRAQLPRQVEERNLLCNELASKEAEILRLSQRLAELEHKILDQASELGLLRQELLVREGNVQQSEAHLVERIKGQAAKICSLELEIQSVCQREARLESRLSDVMSELAAKESSIASQQYETAGYRQQVEVQLAELGEVRAGLTNLEQEHQQVRRELHERIRQVAAIETQGALQDQQVLVLQASLELVDCECSALRIAVTVSAEREQELCSQLQQARLECMDAASKMSNISEKLKQTRCELDAVMESVPVQQEDCSNCSAVQVDEFTQCDLLIAPLPIAKDLAKFTTITTIEIPLTQQSTDRSEQADNQIEYEETKQDSELVRPSKQTQTLEIQGPGMPDSQLRYQLSLANQELTILRSSEAVQPLASAQQLRAHLTSLEQQVASARTEVLHLTQQLQLAEKQNRSYVESNEQLFVRAQKSKQQLEVARQEHARQLNLLQEEITMINEASDKQCRELKKYQQLSNKQQAQIKQLNDQVRSKSQLIMTQEQDFIKQISEVTTQMKSLEAKVSAIPDMIEPTEIVKSANKSADLTFQDATISTSNDLNPQPLQTEVVRNRPRQRQPYRRTIVKMLLLCMTSTSMFHLFQMKPLFAALFKPRTRAIDTEYAFLYI